MSKYDEEKGNVLVARFMGGKYDDATGKWYLPGKDDKPGKESGQLIEELKYSSSWTWQILALKKIKTGVKQKYTNDMNVLSNYMRLEEKWWSQAMSSDDKLRTFKVLIEILVWYKGLK